MSYKALGGRPGMMSWQGFAPPRLETAMYDAMYRPEFEIDPSTARDLISRHIPLNGFGVASDCGANTLVGHDGDCYCKLGYERTDASGDGCVAISPSKPCGPNEARSTVDLKCKCLPGYNVALAPDRFDCLPASHPDAYPDHFPHCKDAAGKSVPDCFFGRSISRSIAPAAVGALAGVLVAGLIFTLAR